MVYFVLKTQATPQATRIFYVLKQEDVPVEDQDRIIHLNCKSVRRFSGMSSFLNYLEQNTSNAMHQTEPYILKRVSWNHAVDMFGFDYDSDTDATDTTISR